MAQILSLPTLDEPTRHQAAGAAANRLLAAMPATEFRRWEPHLKLVE